MDEQSLNEFLRKFSKNTHTEQEHEIFINWIKAASVDQVQKVLDKYAWISEQESGMEPEQHPLLVQKIEMRLDELENKDIQSIKPVRLSSILIKVATVAALLFIVTVFGIYFWRSHKLDKHEIVKAETSHYRNDVTPGGNKAVLTLANGSEIILDGTKNGVLANQGNIVIHKTKDGQLVYEVSDLPQNSQNKKLAFNTISTPRGGQYQVVLPDGSKVWLNAASSVKFPASFSGNERHVELTGEAYFEVAKNKLKPFKVSVNDMQVQVLGTHFNIMAYKDESSTNTTLLEGSVKIIKENENIIIVPGQQARVGRNIQVSNVEAEQTIAWKNGYFIFSHESIESIMRKISRWYDVDIQYNGSITREGFTGSISRSEKVSEILSTLELTGLVHFKIEEGRRIIVMP